MKPRSVIISAFVASIVVILGINAAVAIPVARELGGDSRNKGISLYAYHAFAVAPQGLTLDLWSFEDKAPIDLFRTVFQAADALRNERFERVTFARHGKPMFFMLGSDFRDLGAAFHTGENPVYLVRTLPEKLHRPDGQPAYGHWEGGVLGVLSRQMEDVTTFANEWTAG